MLSLKVKMNNEDDDSHSHNDFDACDKHDENDGQKFEDNLSEYENRDDEEMFLALAKA